MTRPPQYDLGQSKGLIQPGMLLLMLVLSLCHLRIYARETEDVLASIELPPGFEIQYFAKHVPGARSMAQSPSGIIFVGSRKMGRVYAIKPGEKENEVITIAEGLDRPNGVACHGDDLYIAEISRVLKIKNIHQNLHRWHKPTIIFNNLPKDRLHGARYIGFGPDDKLYITVGTPCNACVKNEPYATILRMNSDGSEAEIYARGIRYCEGFTFHPETAALWFTSNSRNWIHDIYPPDELNCASHINMHFGYPYVYGANEPDLEFKNEIKPGVEFTPPILKLGAHVNAGGLCFYTGTQFPESYKNVAFICEGGSTRDYRISGYRITVVDIQGNSASNYRPFAKGWLGFGNQVLGRPTDILMCPDGSLLVSDPTAGCIYQITYNPNSLNNKLSPKLQSAFLDNHSYDNAYPSSPIAL